ncbi:FKBP-type peptidyl-prolyl cis-trans isomerase [Marilutibacter spongiae]|uniref:Peptidyl-prolyl cis-trans isomerase n=1 Tax=Marilutibacter spongiae TaxID=2025720 RepID=A0A7W3TJH0_9GAMM|nr:FKBP-type peptidyl-prolyl cis-trans isomerase [Lysobacter spongiae]MBB1059376.1 FKBP-type peptidyl-prolyl cis-trans isomerase [Lysobacter spongiae]
MSTFLRTTRTALVTTALAIGLAACDKPATEGDAPATPDATTDAATAKPGEGGLAIPGLEGEKAQAGYMIGLQMAKSLEPVKGEIDQDALFDAIRTTLAGDEPLMTDEQAQEVAQAFGQRMQEKMEADHAAQATANADEGKAFLEANAKKEGVKTTASGLQYQVITEGKGAQPKAEDTVRVHYTGKLLDGTVFDDSTEAGEPVEFPLNRVVPGWSEGLQLMTVGSKYRFWIPGELGYGEMGTPGGPIGPNATLVFEVELIEIVKDPGTPAG